MAGTINNVVTINDDQTLGVEADDDGSITLFGHAGQTNGDVQMLSDLVGQTVTVIVALRGTGNGTVGTITGQFYLTPADQAANTLVGPTFVLPSRFDDGAIPFLLVVSFPLAQAVSGLGIIATDVGGDGETEYKSTGVTVIVSD